MIKKYILKYLNYLGRVEGENTVKWITSYLRRLKLGGSVVYLDCGSDDGSITVKIASDLKAKKVFGLDIARDRSKLAKLKGIKVIVSDLNKKFPFRSNSIDVITSLQTIEHLVNVDNFLSEMFRVLKKDGVCIIVTDNLASWHNVFALVLGNQPYSGPYLSKKILVGHHPLAPPWEELKENSITRYRYNMPTHLNVMTTRALVQLCRAFGFDVIEKVGIGMYPFPPFVARILASIDKSHCVFPIVVLKKRN